MQGNDPEITAKCAGNCITITMEKRGRKKNVPTLADFGFSQELIEQIEDLCLAYGGAPPRGAMTLALQHFFNDKGIDAEPEVKKRYLVARERRKAARSVPSV
jgi:hypothetical protein